MKNMIGRKFLYPYEKVNRLWEVKKTSGDVLECSIVDRGFEGTTGLFEADTVIMGELVLSTEEQVQKV